jgi:hypothetical protein
LPGIVGGVLSGRTAEAVDGPTTMIMRTKTIAVVWAANDEVSSPTLLFSVTSSMLNITRFPFCGFSVRLFTSFQRKKLCGIAKKFGFFTEGNEGNEECICCNERQPLFSSVEENISASRPFDIQTEGGEGNQDSSWDRLDPFTEGNEGKQERSGPSKTQPLFSSLPSV